MKKIILSILGIALLSCTNSNSITEKSIEGTWKLVYGSIEQNGSVDVRNMKDANFIKIFNETHFAFFNQRENTKKGFYGGAGTYTLNGTDYVENLDYISSTSFRGQKFEFTLEFKGDTLIQHGREIIQDQNIDRYVVEKYVRVKE